MRVEYKNTFLDLFLYQVSHQFRMPVFQACFLLFSGLIAYSTYQIGSPLESLIVAAVWYAVMWLVQALFMLVFLAFTKRKTLTTSHVISLTDEGLQEESPYSRTVAFWRGGIVKVRRRGGCIAVYITPLSAHLIPVRAFPSAADAAKFQREIEARIEAP